MASTSNKKVSNATMGLRFMQNALRAKQLQETQLEQAKVKDEAEWEVDEEVRASWGLHKDRQASQTAVYETSYIPFLFPSLQSHRTDAPQSSSSSVPPVRGRRKFNKDGNEVAVIEASIPVEALTDSIPSDFPKGKRPSTISGSEATKVRPEGKLTSLPSAGVSVLKMMSEETSRTVGTDLRALRTTKKLAAGLSSLSQGNGSPNLASPPETSGDILPAVSAGESLSPSQDLTLIKTKKPPSGKSGKHTDSNSVTFMRPAGVDSPVPFKPNGSVEKRRLDEDDDTVVGTSSKPSPNPEKRKRKKKKANKSNGPEEP